VSDRVDEYIASLFARDDDVLAALREAADREGLPPISISAVTGRLLQILLSAIGATRVLEVGTLGGYSAIWMARGLPEAGRLVTIEVDERHAEFARRYFARAGLEARIDLRIGRALDVLPAFDGERFDAIFLDADKEPLPTYFDWALRLLRPGGLLIADNALWGGRVLDPETADEGTKGVREFNQRMASDDRVRGTIVPVGDGLAVGVVN
jgi:predicted O-methyltransferase YrrM